MIDDMDQLDSLTDDQLWEAAADTRNQPDIRLEAIQRWLFPEEINLMGLNAVGLGMAALFEHRGVKKRIVVGHDYRSYSGEVKQALMMGLLAGGAEVHDIGLALSPMAYFAQFALDVEGVAMVTASHNDNGWTGIKMGFQRPLTFGPEEMTALKEIVLAGECRTARFPSARTSRRGRR